MQLLDAMLAMTLTLAALATIVTILMESGLRITRMRKKNLVEVMKLINRELEGDKGPLDLNAEQRWNFICRVIENPICATAQELSGRLDKTSAPSSPKLAKTSQTRPTNVTDEILQKRLNALGRDKATGKSLWRRILTFVSQIFGDKKRYTLYDKR